MTGSKMWHICAPSNAWTLYGAGEVDTFRPDYVKYPNFRHADCYLDTIVPGEFMFYPADYWHQTRNLVTPSIAITSTAVDQNNWRLVAAEFEAACAHNKYSWALSGELCAALRNCFGWWENRFETQHRFAHESAKDQI